MQHLPTELLLLIIGELRAPHDLIALCCVSQRLHVLARPLLQEALGLPPGAGVFHPGYLRTFYAAFAVQLKEGAGRAWPCPGSWAPVTVCLPVLPRRTKERRYAGQRQSALGAGSHW
ncbi:hypothetical protein AB1N83_007851 [Pleurotus pulmonarius]